MEEKRVRNAKIQHFICKTCKWYRYPLCRGEVVPVPLKVVPIPIGSVGLVPVPVKVVLVPLLPTTLFLHIFESLSPVFIHRMFRDPN